MEELNTTSDERVETEIETQMNAATKRVDGLAELFKFLEKFVQRINENLNLYTTRFYNEATINTEINKAVHHTLDSVMGVNFVSELFKKFHNEYKKEIESFLYLWGNLTAHQISAMVNAKGEKILITDMNKESLSRITVTSLLLAIDIYYKELTVPQYS
jgi:hypothetical protein